jgi:hypothetical protein
MRKRSGGKGNESAVIDIQTCQPETRGQLGAFSRYYPPREARDHAISQILQIESSNRSPDQW